MSESQRPQPGRGTPGRHRGAAAPVRLSLRLPGGLPLRTLGVRTAVGAVLVAGTGVAALGADAAEPTTVAAASTSQTTETAVAFDSVDASMRLLDERVSRAAAAERELPTVPRMRATATPAPTPLTIETIAPPPPAPTTEAPPPAPAPAPTTTTPAPTRTPTRTPTPTTTSTTTTTTTTKAPAPVAKTTPTPTATPKASATAAAPAGISYAPCADGSAVESGLTPDGIRVHRAVCARFSGVSGWGGLRGGGDNHGTGRALDIMIGSNSSLGAAIAAFVRENASALGVSEVIYAQKIWTVQRASEGWRAMSDRGSATANHYDHVHVSVYGSSGTG